jgi:WhiB family redox-sensing transcriptional regulator
MSTTPLENGTSTRAGWDWRDDALCTRTDPELFFPHQGGSGSRSVHANFQTDAAKKWCAACTVAGDCLAEAVSRGPATEGIWGGTTKDERDRMRRADARYRQSQAKAARESVGCDQ